jgi:hypothetical protein
VDKALELRVSCGKQFLNEFLAEFNSSKKIFLSELQRRCAGCKRQ